MIFLLPFILFFAVFAFVQFYMRDKQKYLTTEQKAQLLDFQQKKSVYSILIMLIFFGLITLPLFKQKGNVILLAWITYLILAAIYSTYSQISKYRQLKTLGFPKNYLNASLISSAIFFISSAIFYTGIIIFIGFDLFSLHEKFKASSYSPSTVSTAEFPHACPSIAEIQKQLPSMKPGDTKIWHDNKGLAWTISTPRISNAPFVISDFYQANWTGSFYTMGCSYLVANSHNVINVVGNFNVEKPLSTVPWQQVSGNVMTCQGAPENCGFNLLSSSKQPNN